MNFIILLCGSGISGKVIPSWALDSIGFDLIQNAPSPGSAFRRPDCGNIQTFWFLCHGSILVISISHTNPIGIVANIELTHFIPLQYITVSIMELWWKEYLYV